MIEGAADVLLKTATGGDKKRKDDPNVTPSMLQRFYATSTGAGSIYEKVMTKKDIKKRDEIADAISTKEMKDRYGDKNVKYAIATKMVMDKKKKKKEMSEQLGGVGKKEAPLPPSKIKANLSREQNIAVAKNEKKSKQGMSRVMTASYDMGTNVTESDLVIQDWNVDKIKYTEVEAVDIIKPEPLKPSPSNWRQEVELDERFRFDPKIVKMARIGVKRILKGKGPFNVTGTQTSYKKGTYKPPSKDVSNQIQVQSIKNKLQKPNIRLNTPSDVTSSLGTSKRLVKNPDFKNLTKKLASEKETKKVVKKLVTKKKRAEFIDDNRLTKAQNQKGLNASQKKKIKEFEKLEKQGQLNLFSKNKGKTKGSNIVPVEKSPSKVTSKKGSNIVPVEKSPKRTTKTEPYYVTKQNKKITLNTTTPQKGLELKGEVTTGNQIGKRIKNKFVASSVKRGSTPMKDVAKVARRYGYATLGGAAGTGIGYMKGYVEGGSNMLDTLQGAPSGSGNKNKPTPPLPKEEEDAIRKDFERQEREDELRKKGYFGDIIQAKKRTKKTKLNAHYDWRVELDDDVLYRLDRFNEDWQKVNKKDKTDGMSQKAVNAYKRENPGSKLKTAVTTKPSKLKKGSKASKRRKSFCARSNGQKKMHNIDCSKTPDKAICKARRRWNC